MDNSPERPNLDALKLELTAITDQLERADENENPVERFFQQDELLELSDWLQDEIASAEPTEKQV